MGLIRAAVVVVEDGAGVSDAVPPSWLVLIVEQLFFKFFSPLGLLSELTLFIL